MILYSSIHLFEAQFSEFSKIDLNEIKRAGVHDDGVFNECKFSDQEFDDEIASITSNSKDNDDAAADDDDDDDDD